jgi:hypothetical protein
LKVPRESSLVLLVEVYLRKGKSLGSEEGKVSECGLFYKQKRSLAWALFCIIGINFYINVERLQ